MMNRNLYFKKIELNSHAEDIYSKIGKNESLMSETDHGFLCGLLEQYKPKKILEVGVYAGGTTIAVLDMLQRLGLKDSELYSVDLAKQIEQSKEVGYMVEEAKEYLGNLEHFHLYTGVTAAEVLEEITGDWKFDFAIIDTAHYLPGEILDFLACYPFMEDEAVVVLHDVMLNQKDKHRAAATKTVFDIVVGEKIWNWDMEEYPNIAAVRLNNDTGKYIKDLISALSLSWYYNPGDEILRTYRNIIEKYYDKEALAIFDKMVSLNMQWWQETSACVHKAVRDIVDALLSKDENRLFIYGTGKMGRIYFNYLKKNHLADRLAGFIVSDDQNIPDKKIENVTVYHLSDIDYEKGKDVIVNSVEHPSVSQMLMEKGIEFVKLSGIVKEAVLMRT